MTATGVRLGGAGTEDVISFGRGRAGREAKDLTP
jgi:hypothetical protein